VPAPTGTCWARLYIQQTELDVGESEHNVFGGAASTDEPNSPGMIEFAEDVGVAFNTSDDVRARSSPRSSSAASSCAARFRTCALHSLRVLSSR
jgi:hypothetical protein